MVAPSKAFTVIPDADVDPDSPVTTTLMVALQSNDIHLEEWLGDSFVAAKDHDHDGANSAIVAGPSSALKLIEKVDIAVAVDSFDFSTTLNGDTDEQFIMTGFWATGSQTFHRLQLRVNGSDQTGISNSTLDTTKIIVAEFDISAPRVIFFHAWIKTKSDAVNTFLDTRLLVSTVVRNQASGVVDAPIFGGDFTPGLGTNITSFGLKRLGGGPVNQITVGSQFALYKIPRV